MRLLEFQSSPILMLDLIHALGRVFDMERVGGEARVYQVGDRQGIIFLLNNSMRALGLIWSKGSTYVQSVAVWNHINFNVAPDFITDLPADVSLDGIIEPLIRFIRSPHEGLSESTIMETIRNVSPAEFRAMARALLKDKAKKMSLEDLKKVAEHNDVHIPSAIRHDKSLRVDANHWNLFDDDTANAARQVGAKVGVPDPNDPHYHTAVELAKVRNLKNMASSGQVVLLGRKGNGEVFEIPGIDEITAKIERMLSKELKAGAHVGNSMEDQYAELDKKVRLVAGGKAEFVKSLLITGMPSAGKTFRVMQTLNSLGLKKGKDYVVIGGKTTVSALYRTLVEQADNGLAVFDDCDSVVADKDGRNMLKKALDTDPVREVSYNAKGLLNTSVMEPEERTKLVSAMSRILRGVPSPEDIYLLDPYRGLDQREYNIPSKEQLRDEWEDATDQEIEDYIKEYTAGKHEIPKTEIIEVQNWCIQHLPNTIDFQGRVIFISNMRADEWDSAILTRAFHQDMEFSDAEMFDYIETILQHIKTPQLTEADKKEVLDLLRSLWEQGKITRPVNFRLVQQAFDLRLMNGWQSLLANIG